MCVVLCNTECWAVLITDVCLFKYNDKSFGIQRAPIMIGTTNDFNFQHLPI